MIRKLRRKFILINMALVSLVLLVVFGAICLSSYQRMERESMDGLRRSLEKEGGLGPPKLDLPHPKEPFFPFPVFQVSLDADGNILAVLKGNFEVSDEMAETAVGAAMGSGRDSGVLAGLSLRYMKKRTAEGTRLVFADTTEEGKSILNLVLTSLLVGAGSLAAFFLISLFLANWALRPVERAWKQQRQFVADASHELKTPLTVILANTGILLSHRAYTIERQAKWVEHTQDEALRMKKLVDDLLFLAKSDNTKTGVCAAFSLSDAVWSALLPFESVAFEQGVALESEIAPDLTAEGDEAKIRQLAAILLDNACKYAGNPGRVEVKLRAAEGRGILSVSNSGEPIAPEHLERLFERFYRADNSRAREAGGYGLGLSIAKSIADEQRGRISVESDLKKGTVFTVSLPLRRQAMTFLLKNSDFIS